MTNADLLVCDIVARGATTRPDVVAMIEAGRTITWIELHGRVRRLAQLFQAHGMVAGDRIAVMAPNSINFLEVLFAASTVGAAVVPLNTRLVASEIRFQADDSGARFAVVHPDFAVVASNAGLDALDRFEINDALDGEIGAFAVAARRARPTADSVLIQLYTSGTTGRPKGCLLTQRAWLAATASLAHHFNTQPGDVVMTSLPFFHVGGLGFALHGLAAGALVVLPTPGHVLDEIEEHRVTIAGIPFDLAALGRHPDAARIGSSLRAIMGHAAARSIPALPGVEVWNGYGLTESCGLAVMARAEARARRDGLLGQPMLHVDVAIADDEGELLGADEPGEIVMRSPSVTTGYWNLPDATADTRRDGWVHTGDLGRIDPAGNVYFLDRAKDMVKPGGENVYGVEVENIILQHPAVAECAVIGVPDKRWGEAVKAVVVLKVVDASAGNVDAFDAAELDRWCLANLAPYKRPRWYEMVTSIPRNATGKVLKHELRDAHDPANATRLPERS